MAGGNAVKERKILIVDDENSIREALTIFFNGEGYEAGQATDGKEALKKIEKKNFDIIICDIRMDRMDGVRFIKKLKERKKNIPVIFITAYPELNTAIEALRNGVAEYIIKPFDMRKLKEKVSLVLEEKNGADREAALMDKIEEKKKEFLSRFSGELCAPLKPMAAYVHLLIKEEFGSVSVHQMEVLKKIQKSSRKMKMLVDDLVLLFRIENMEEPLKQEEHNLNDLVNEIIGEQRDLLKERNHGLEITIYDEIESITCDRDKIKRVVTHLIDNAAKFSVEGGKIHLRIRRYRFNGGGYIKISVQDESEKLRGQDKKVVFRWFYEVNKAGDLPDTSGTSGLGIGLTLARLIVEAHRGKIWLEDSEEGDKEGNTFSFIIPEAEENSGPESHSQR